MTINRSTTINSPVLTFEHNLAGLTLINISSQTSLLSITIVCANIHLISSIQISNRHHNLDISKTKHLTNHHPQLYRYTHTHACPLWENSNSTLSEAQVNPEVFDDIALILYIQAGRNSSQLSLQNISRILSLLSISTTKTLIHLLPELLQVSHCSFSLLSPLSRAFSS